MIMVKDANRLKLIRKTGSVVGSREVAKQRMLARLHIPALRETGQQPEHQADTSYTDSDAQYFHKFGPVTFLDFKRFFSHIHLSCECCVWCLFPYFLLTSCCHQFVIRFLRFVKSAVRFFFVFFLWVIEFLCHEKLHEQWCKMGTLK